MATRIFPFRARYVLAVLLLTTAHADTDRLESTEKAAGDWIKIRLETTRLETEWLTDRPLLESTVEGLKQRAASLEEKSNSVKASTAKDRAELAGLRGKDQAAQDDLHDAGARLSALSDKLMTLRPSLPPRLSEALDLLYRSLGATGMSTGARMQVAMSVLNRCVQFNRTITYGEDVLAIDGEPGEKSLEVIYWGLSHGYALDRASGKAWYGSPGQKGWHWESLPDSAPRVEELIAVYNDKTDPAFVPVPATLTAPAEKPAAK